MICDTLMLFNVCVITNLWYVDCSSACLQLVVIIDFMYVNLKVEGSNLSQVYHFSLFYFYIRGNFILINTVF